MLKFCKNVTTRIRKLRPKDTPEFNLLILGLNNSGKSTLAGRLIMETEEAVSCIKACLY